MHKYRGYICKFSPKFEGVVITHCFCFSHTLMFDLYVIRCVLQFNQFTFSLPPFLSLSPVQPVYAGDQGHAPESREGTTGLLGPAVQDGRADKVRRGEGGDVRRGRKSVMKKVCVSLPPPPPPPPSPPHTHTHTFRSTVEFAREVSEAKVMDDALDRLDEMFGSSGSHDTFSPPRVGSALPPQGRELACVCTRTCMTWYYVLCTVTVYDI